MGELGLRARQRRAQKRTTVPGKEPVISADLIGWDFATPGSGPAAGRDITYLRTSEGWLYLARL